MGAAQSGVVLFIASMAVFAMHDGVTKLLTTAYSPIMLVMIRYWAFLAFVLAISARRPGGLKAASQTSGMGLQAARGLLMAGEIAVTNMSIALVGLAETFAVFSVFPLLTTALSAVVLGERVSVAQWAAVAAGAVGVMIIIDPGGGVLELKALLPLLGALMFAGYAVLTRMAARHDPAPVSFFYTAVFGMLGSSLVGPFFWTDIQLWAAPWMLLLCALAVLSQYLLIQAYDMSEASALQPFAYSHVVFVSLIGVMFFEESIHAKLLIGASIVVGAGLLAWLWGRRAAQRL